MSKQYIPVLKRTDGSVEMFTTKFNGIVFDSWEAMMQADKSNAWLCAYKDVALMRAYDAKMSTIANKTTQKASEDFIEITE